MLLRRVKPEVARSEWKGRGTALLVRKITHVCRSATRISGDRQHGEAAPLGAAVVRGGLDGWLISGPIAQVLNLPQPTGYLVKTVAKGSPGEAVGLRGGAVSATIMGEPYVVGGDIILKVQGIPVSDAADHRRVRDILTSLPPGAQFTMTVLRLGQVIELTGRHP